MHAATLVYNVFGERVFAAGQNGTPDCYEQPFNSLDLTYSWYPLDTITVKVKLKNLLDEEKTIEQDGVETFNRTVGSSASIGVKWEY